MRLLLQARCALGGQLAQLADEAVQKCLVSKVRLCAHIAIGGLVSWSPDCTLPADVLRSFHQVLPPENRMSHHLVSPNEHDLP